MERFDSFLYVSRPRAGLTEADLAAILASARRHNNEDGLTGFLAFNGDAFVQVLEGPSVPLQHCIERLRVDTRHVDIRMLGFFPGTQRRFHDWSMGYAAVATRHRPLITSGAPSGNLVDVDAVGAARLLEVLAEESRAVPTAPVAPLASPRVFSANSARWPAA